MKRPHRICKAVINKITFFYLAMFTALVSLITVTFT